MSSEPFRARRQRVLNRLGDGVLVLPTAPVRFRNGDVAHAFRPGSDFHYLTGFDEPEAVLVATRSSARAHHAILFLRPREPEREIWNGPRLGPRRAVKQLGFDEAYPMASLYERLEVILGKTKRLFYTLGADGLMDRSLERVFERLAIADYRANPSAHPVIEDPGPMIATERLVKDRDEIEALDRAAVLSAAGHRRAMAFARPGIMEYELQAEVESTFRRLGSRRNGYESIVASGSNACVLHYVSNDRKMRPGELVLLDAGAELAMYTADITRTFPVSGTFSEPQAEIYRIVLRAQKAALRAVSPGRLWSAPHQAAVRATIDGLRALGLLKGQRKKLIAKQAHRPWFMHGTSHWLGMDVHDAGGYVDPDGKPRRLRVGMVLTVEPGLYFSPRDRSVPKRYRGIGVRIEDDVLVTRIGRRVLTEDVPKEISAVERLCRGQEA